MTTPDDTAAWLLVPWFVVDDRHVIAVDEGWPSQVIDVGLFACEDAARHIAALHNAWLHDLHMLTGRDDATEPTSSAEDNV